MKRVTRPAGGVDQVGQGKLGCIGVEGEGVRVSKAGDSFAADGMEFLASLNVRGSATFET